MIAGGGARSRKAAKNHSLTENRLVYSKAGSLNPASCKVPRVRTGLLVSGVVLAWGPAGIQTTEVILDPLIFCIGMIIQGSLRSRYCLPIRSPQCFFQQYYRFNEFDPCLILEAE